MEEPSHSEQQDLSLEDTESSDIPIALAVDDAHHLAKTEHQDTSVTAETAHDLPPDSLDQEQDRRATPDQELDDGAESQLQHESSLDTSELSHTATESEAHDGDDSSSVGAQRRHSLRTEALIQAAARAVVSMRKDGGDSQQGDEGGSSTHDAHYFEEHDSSFSRPESSASDALMSPIAESSVGGRTYSSSRQGTEDDLFSVRSPLSSRGSAYDRCDDDAYEQMTEKGSDSPQIRSRVVSGVSASGASALSDFSRLSRYEKEEFVPTSRGKRPAFRSPSAVRAIQMSSPAPSVTSASSRTHKTPNGLPTVSRIGSPTAVAQHPGKGRSTPTRFKKEEAPLVLLHVTLLPLRWAYGDVLDHFEARKSAPDCFSNESMKNLRGAWRQVQDRLGDTVLERGILLPHPQSDYEVLEERMLEALELPLRRRARILECGHYLGPSNDTSASDDGESDYGYTSDQEGSDHGAKEEKRHWCTFCKGDIRYEELGSERIFRIKVYASNGLMSPGAWEACWKEMERVDIEVEPIVDKDMQMDIGTLSAILDAEQQQRLEAEQSQQLEDEQRMQLEVEQRLSLEQERQELETQRRKFEEERRQALQESEQRLEEERRKLEEEQRQRLDEERRQKFEEDRRLLESQRQQFEEQRIELEEQRKLIEEEQRQHLEESRRRELEDEHQILDEQRQELEEARQKFEEEQTHITSPRPISRTSYVEDDAASRSRDGAMSTELGPRRRDTERLREIYGNNASSADGFPNPSSPTIHIHVDSKRQRDEDPSSRQLALATRDNDIRNEPIQETRRPESYAAPPLSPPPPTQSYSQAEPPRRSLDAASLPELLGETIRVLLQDPKNVAIAVLVVALAVLWGGHARTQDRASDVYTPQPRYHSHQFEGREPAAQVFMNTAPAVQQVQSQWSAPSPIVETVYKTVTAEPASTSTVTRDVEVVYQTVTKQAPQETPTRLVETIYSTITESVAMPPVQHDESESPPLPPVTSVDPSVASFDFLQVGNDSVVVDTAPTSPFTPVGLDIFACPMWSFVPGLDSDEDNFKIDTHEGTEVEIDVQEPDATDLADLAAAARGDDLDTASSLPQEGEAVRKSTAMPLTQESRLPVTANEAGVVEIEMSTKHTRAIEDDSADPTESREIQAEVGWFLGPYVDMCRPFKLQKQGMRV
ncbi:hypothetical protein BD289DRAFT_470782 [Coniella lustricola]|uniref:Pathway-specific nitrogen regulator n=1 Tax=Coniella lustricola TaxID=2025994 RepID=A0A2T3ALU2_9PEZI|nr:hypothetical protein BD289DRAFT_470782 [Coniella lustricola]